MPPSYVRRELLRTPLRRSSVVPRPGAPTSGGTVIRLAGIVGVLCTTGYTPPILYIRREARLGAAGPSDLTALQNSREVHTLRLATACYGFTPRMRQGMLPIGNTPPHSPGPAPLKGRRAGELATANFREFLFHEGG